MRKHQGGLKLFAAAVLLAAPGLLAASAARAETSGGSVPAPQGQANKPGQQNPGGRLPSGHVATPPSHPDDHSEGAKLTPGQH